MITGCSDSAPEIEPPEVGGQLVHIEGSQYSLMVRYRDGQVIETTATLVDENDMPKLIKSVDEIYEFQVPQCGNLTFAEPRFGPGIILMPDDADVATGAEGCPIHFGALEDKWVLK